MTVGEERTLDGTTDPWSRPSGQTTLSLVVYHQDGAQVIALESDTSMVIGRSDAADIVVRDVGLSRRHARFEADDDQIWVEDLSSRNGTKLNGTRITRTAFRLGDVVTMAGVRVALQMVSERQLGVAPPVEYEAFREALAGELERARSEGHPLALVAVHSSEEEARTGDFWPALNRVLRPIDLRGLYSAHTLLLALPEHDAEQAERLAKQVLSQLPASLGARCAIAAYPKSGLDVETLLDECHAALERTSEIQTLVIARDRDKPRWSSPIDPKPVLISEQMKALYRKAARVGESDVPVLITGETGSGKEVLARAIHAASGRGALCCVNCGGIPSELLENTLFGHERGAFTGAVRTTKGVLETADGGTVMLDEIGELAPSAQAALLRVLETHRVVRVGGSREWPVDIRIIAATNRDLESMCDTGEFRRDLLYRLNTVTLDIPPLRERRAEIPVLAEHFLAEQRHGASQISSAAMDRLGKYDWPGNVRELRSAITRAAVLCEGPLITVDDLPVNLTRAGERRDSTDVSDDVPIVGGLKHQLRRREMELIEQALRQAEGNQTSAAKLLGVSRRSLVRKIREYGIGRE